MKQKELIKVSTYARRECITTQWVYKLAEQKKIKIVEIDGVKFVEI